MTGEERWFNGEPNPEDQQYQDHMAAQQAEQYEYEMERQQATGVVEDLIATLHDISAQYHDMRIADAIDNLTNLVIPCLRA